MLSGVLHSFLALLYTIFFFTFVFTFRAIHFLNSSNRCLNGVKELLDLDAK